MSNETSLENYIKIAQCKINMLQDLGYTITKDMKILDFGCGAGNLVKAFRKLGYDAYGADIMENPESLERKYYRVIKFAPYIIPYEDDSFDFVFSTSVFEHVLNTEESFREIYRVLKPGGFTLHSLPSRYRLRESHIHVPLGGLIQASWWVKMWAFLGVRNEFQQGLDWKEVANRNMGFYETELNYHSFKELKNIVISVFGNIGVAKKEYIKNMPGGAARLGRLLPIPGYASLVFFFREWEIYMKKVE